jgi:4-diphosphocytidyl-2-C-methyl-D-erythritol kinase
MLQNRETAFAKINLALHVRRRRDDGYHDIETLFAFLDFGDELWLEGSDKFDLCAEGEFADSMGGVNDNLITRAARLVHNGALPPQKFNILKRLPVAAGLGGGSADAAAALRLMGAGGRYDYAEALGADVPACLASMPVAGRGTGTETYPVINDVSGLACILVNPLIPVSTKDVFARWDGEDHGPMPEGTAFEIMTAGRNDLQRPAIELCPEIAEVIDYLVETAPVAVRMSGSGASCFAIYQDYDHAAEQACELKNIRKDWWVQEGRLR